jgi:hypothetical protein
MKRAGRVLALAVIVTACGSDAIDCVLPPCAYPMALIVTVTSTSSTQPLSTDVFIKETAPNTIDLPCSPGPTAMCYVPGTAGQYQIQIGAPGFQTVTKTADVVAHAAPKCGCPSNETVRLDIALAPASPTTSLRRSTAPDR